MQTQRTELNFKGQKLFIGIDVHLKSWTVTILTEYLFYKTFTQPASVEALFNYLNRNFLAQLIIRFTRRGSVAFGLITN